MSWIDTLSETPMPTILVVAGLFFIFLAISGGIKGKVKVPLARQYQSGFAGILLLSMGLAIYIIPSQEAGNNSSSSDSGRMDRNPASASTVTNEADGSASIITPNPNFEIWPILHSPDFFSANRHWKESDEKFTGYTIKRGLSNGAVTLSITDIGVKEKDGAHMKTRIPVDPMLDFEISADFTWKKNRNRLAVSALLSETGVQIITFTGYAIAVL